MWNWLSVKNIIPEYLQYVDELSSINITSTLDSDMTTQILKFLNKTKLDNLI